jgi:hypothetical protein
MSVTAAIKSNLPLVIDADGLWGITQDTSAYVSQGLGAGLATIFGYERCILTPNAVEFDRLRLKILDCLQDHRSNLYTLLLERTGAVCGESTTGGMTINNGSDGSGAATNIISFIAALSAEDVVSQVAAVSGALVLLMLR